MSAFIRAHAGRASGPGVQQASDSASARTVHAAPTTTKTSLTCAIGRPGALEAKATLLLGEHDC